MKAKLTLTFTLLAMVFVLTFVGAWFGIDNKIMDMAAGAFIGWAGMAIYSFFPKSD